MEENLALTKSTNRLRGHGSNERYEAVPTALFFPMANRGSLALAVCISKHERFPI